MKLSVVLMRGLTKLFYIFPIKKDKVILTAYNGRLYTCNPKYIAEGLVNTGKYKVLYATRDSCKDIIPERIERIRYRSLKHFYHLMTAGFVIFNSTGFSGFLPYRKRQTIIQTWHGGYSFKVIGNEIFTDKDSVEKRKLTGDLLTYFLSGSEMASNQHSKAMGVAREKFLDIGLPRNDILFQDQSLIKAKIYKKFGMSDDTQFVLYAPTYRDGPVQAIKDYEMEPIDDIGVVNALEKRFGGKFVFIYKAHHDMLPTNIGKNCINASNYSDIQELMCAAAVIITDYSSCMADFALQRRPGFLFTPDLKEYESVHPFSMDPKEWPYQTAISNKELIRNISEYDDKKGLDKIEGFFEKIGNCDDGHSVSRLIDIMNKRI